MTQRVIVDSNVLASRVRLDWLFHLQIDNEGMFSLYASNDIYAETVRVLRKRNPRARGKMIRDRVGKIKACLGEKVSDLPDDLPFSGTDEGDYHVHAAAIEGQADILLTFNKSVDFTADPDNEPYEIYHPDDFFQLVIQSNPSCLLPTVRGQFEYWSLRPKHNGLERALHDAQCPEFAKIVREALSEIAQRM
ncbi:PIN domain-containing protein [Corynebacterium breve]|uniref:PIN domain-containing protein n=1 Tax=Corynebacterium breve TaxID=3049799 RepID=A0ABY8VD47_9CORY|nr:PIN domain-containing protein [Corynebacterium breve]WIM67379.1 PIN domain-containing protein [Corynebacterium breve]